MMPKPSKLPKYSWSFDKTMSTHPHSIYFPLHMQEARFGHIHPWLQLKTVYYLDTKTWFKSLRVSNHLFSKKMFAIHDAVQIC